MAPEQLEGKEADTRTDVWGFGCLFYEMATGSRAFGGSSTASVIAAILEREPAPISDDSVMTSGALGAIISTSLRKNPDDRWQSVHDIRVQLEQIRRRSVADNRVRTGRGWAAPLGVAATAAVAALAWYGRPSPPSPEPAHVIFSVPAPGGMLTGPGTGVTPDGKYLARLLSDQKDGVPSLWLRPLDAPTFRQVHGTERAAGIFYSPDSQHVGFADRGRLKTVAISGGPVNSLADIRVPRGGAWSGRGIIVYSPDDRGPLWAVAAAGGEPKRLTSLDESKQETTHRYPYFLPDDNHFVFLVRSMDARHSGLCLSSLDDPAHHTFIVPSDSDASYSMDHLLFVRQGTLLAQRFNLKTLTTNGEPLTVAADVDYVPESGRASFGTGASGVLTYFSTRRAITRLVMFSRSGDRLSDGSSPGFYADFNIVARGQQIVFGRRERSDASSGDLWLLDVARNTETRLVTGLRLNSRVLRGDDNHVLIGTSEGDSATIARHDLKGATDVEDVLHLQGAQIWDVSPDGRLVLFSRNGNLWLRSADGAERLVVQAPGTQLATPALSPTGDRLLYLSNETGRPELYARDIVGTLGRERLSPEGAVDPAWSRDAREVFFRGLDGSFFVLTITGSGRDAKFGRPRRLFSAPLPFSAPGRS